LSTDEKQPSDQNPEGTYTGEFDNHETDDQPVSMFEEGVSTDQSHSVESELQEVIEVLRKQAEDHQQRYLRAQADLDNFRRRARIEKEDYLKYASLKIIEPLLTIKDNFERALTSSKETNDFDALVKGIDMVYRHLEQMMEQEGVMPIEAVGQLFNPQFHEAIMQVEAEGVEEGIIVEEIVKGYMMKDRVIRPAMVKVSI
jgi:molecular chaperone GrpE